MKKLILASFAAVVLSFGAAKAEETETLYKFYCAQCHGFDGNGDGPNVSQDFPVTPRNFNKGDVMGKLSDADLVNVIKEGGPSVSKSPMMPPWGKTLTDAEIAGLVKKLRVLCKCKGPS
ncbi:MAG TPA: cytochrome c [Rhodospirillales bacterium]|nr:cytochrome c [Rhodospirillales bacterium]